MSWWQKICFNAFKGALVSYLWAQMMLSQCISQFWAAVFALQLMWLPCQIHMMLQEICCQAFVIIKDWGIFPPENLSHGMVSVSSCCAQAYHLHLLIGYGQQWPPQQTHHKKTRHHKESNLVPGIKHLPSFLTFNFLFFGLCRTQFYKWISRVWNCA